MTALLLRHSGVASEFLTSERWVNFHEPSSAAQFGDWRKLARLLHHGLCPNGGVPRLIRVAGRFQLSLVSQTDPPSPEFSNLSSINWVPGSPIPDDNYASQIILGSCSSHPTALIE